jgi:hypothetical protein
VSLDSRRTVPASPGPLQLPASSFSLSPDRGMLDRTPNTAMTPINCRNSFGVTLCWALKSLQASFFTGQGSGSAPKNIPPRQQQRCSRGHLEHQLFSLGQLVRTTASIVLIGVAIAIARSASGSMSGMPRHSATARCGHCPRRAQPNHVSDLRTRERPSISAQSHCSQSTQNPKSFARFSVSRDFSLARNRAHSLPATPSRGCR